MTIKGKPMTDLLDKNKYKSLVSAVEETVNQGQNLYQKALTERYGFTEAKMENSEVLAESTISLRVMDPEYTVKDFKRAGIRSVKLSRRHSNEVEIDSKDKEKVIAIMRKHGWDKRDIKDVYPELMEEQSVSIDESASLIKDYEKMSADGKKDANIIDTLMSMPKYKNMSRDQISKAIGDHKRKGIFKR